jgi:hypothetical protein
MPTVPPLPLPGDSQIPKLGQGAAFASTIAAQKAHMEEIKFQEWQEKQNEHKAQLQAKLNVQKIQHQKLLLEVEEATVRLKALEAEKSSKIKPVAPPRKTEGRKFR